MDARVMRRRGSGSWATSRSAASRRSTTLHPYSASARGRRGGRDGKESDLPWWGWVLLGIGAWCVASVPIALGLAKRMPKNPTEEDVIAHEVEEANRRDRRNSGNGYDA